MTRRMASAMCVLVMRAGIMILVNAGRKWLIYGG